MTPTDHFYAGDVYVDEVDFNEVSEDEALREPRPTSTLSYSRLAMGLVAGVLTISLAGIPLGSVHSYSDSSSAAEASYASESSYASEAEGNAGMHAEKARHARALFRDVPLSTVDDLPDPDYGF